MLCVAEQQHCLQELCLPAGIALPVSISNSSNVITPNKLARQDCCVLQQQQRQEQLYPPAAARGRMSDLKSNAAGDGPAAKSPKRGGLAGLGWPGTGKRTLESRDSQNSTSYLLHNESLGGL